MTEPTPAPVFAFDFASKTTPLPTPTASSIPDWKGFNLLEMFMQGSNDTDFDENTFKTIHELGFNFVRLPLDYRVWTFGGSWEKVDESALQRLDKAVEYGIRYDIHVCINFHRGPGYTVAQPAEETDLWTDASAQAAFAKLWGIIARRYKDVPAEYLSFNLINEPGEISSDAYVAAMKPAIDLIRAERADRLIILDGLRWCADPIPQAKELGVALAARGYHPSLISHYHASWMEGADKYPYPEWPVLYVPQYFYGKDKPDLQSDLVLKGDFAAEQTLDVHVMTVSQTTELVVLADGKEVYRHPIASGKGQGVADGSGEWKTEVYSEEWGIYQNIFDRDYTAVIPAGTKEITVRGGKGDWMTWSGLKLYPTADPSKKLEIEAKNNQWGDKFPAAIVLTADGKIDYTPGVNALQDRDWLRSSYLQPWIDCRDSGVGVMIGEWGAHNQTPHDVTLRWMEDWLSLYKEHGFSWALWNFDGSFGICNSTREDVDYVSFNGFELDKEMSDLLVKYK